MDTLARPDLVGPRRVMWAFLSAGFAVFALMMVAGIAMRAAQANWFSLNPATFYALMTLHGSGMIVAMAMCGMGALWYLMRLQTKLSEGVAWTSFALVVAGVAAVVISVVAGRFGAAWTMLYPLPFTGATWPSWATGTFLIGYALFTVGWLFWCVQMLGCALLVSGGFRGALGLDYVFRNEAFTAAGGKPPTPQGLAALVAGIDGILTGAAGMLIGTALLAHWIDPNVKLDPLWAKNVTYFFGHALANLTIYLAVVAVYVGLPRYSGREYHTSVPLVVAWWGTLLFVAIAYFHHLYMDFVQMQALQYIGEAVSYLAALPVAVVTVFGGMVLVYRARMRWTMASMFIFAGLIGWVVGGIGALLDATVPFNVDLHNTLWVPAHFHTYLLEGVLLFIIGWAFIFVEEGARAVTPAIVRWLTGIGVFGGGAVFLIGFYVAGAAGVPRRYAVEPAPGPDIASWSTIGAILVAAGLLVALVEAVRLARAPRTA
ncbi:MAG TPA: cbb3-type cytochrome c oxidase subunit I [Candidatus Eremiobacteraceae bacterium]